VTERSYRPTKARLARAPAVVAVAARSTGSGKNNSVSSRATTKRNVDDPQTESREPTTTDDVIVVPTDRLQQRKTITWPSGACGVMRWQATGDGRTCAV